jgi:putative transposase
VEAQHIASMSIARPSGYPTFRKKGQNDAFRYPDPKQIKIEGERIFLPKAGWTRIVVHRPIVGKVKNVTVSTIAGDWSCQSRSNMRSRSCR